MWSIRKALSYAFIGLWRLRNNWKNPQTHKLLQLTLGVYSERAPTAQIGFGERKEIFLRSTICSWRFYWKLLFNRSSPQKKSQGENFLSYPICFVSSCFALQPRVRNSITRGKIESAPVYGIGYSSACYCMWIIQNWTHKKLNTSVIQRMK